MKLQHLFFTAPSETKSNVDCQSGGLHPPSNASLNSIVRVARRRIKYMSVCGAGGNMPGDIASEVLYLHTQLIFHGYLFSTLKYFQKKS